MSLHDTDMQYISIGKVRTFYHETDDYDNDSDLVFKKRFGYDKKREILSAKLSIQLSESSVYLTHILSVSLFYFFLESKLQRFIWKILKAMYITYVYIYIVNMY